MNRFLMLASTGLFVTGLAVLPASVHAQANAAMGATTNTGVSTTAPLPGAKADASVNSSTKSTASRTNAPGTAAAGAASVKTATPSATTSVSGSAKVGG